MRGFRLALFAAVLALAGAVPASGQEVEQDTGRVTVGAVHLAEALSVDGLLDEPVYRSAPAITRFVQQVPNEGRAATEQTEAWVMFDRSNVYVAARCWDSSPPGEWVANEMRRDAAQLGQNDTFGVLFDTFHDGRDGFLFYTNPLGALADQQITDEQSANGDWNPVWQVRTARFEGGWSVEMQIPFKSLRYGPGAAQAWGIQLRRVVRRLNEWSYITPVPISAAGRDGSQGILRISQAATLVGLEVPAGSRNLEIKPYGITQLTTDRTARPSVVNDTAGDVGVDVKYGLTQNLTADFTYNTDFAQVEADEQQVNLTRFSLAFPEKREFFLEGRGLFDFSRSGGAVPTLFYSRRIGLEDGHEVPIVAGSRLTGKVGAYGIGALNIQTGSSDDVGAVPTNFSVVRLKRELLRRGAIGAMFTSRSHAVGGDGTNQAYGLDAKLVFREDVNINAYVARTVTPGLTGQNTSYLAQFDYPSDRYGLRVEHLLVGKHFNPETGLLRRSNFRRTFAEGRFSPRPRSLPAIRQFTFEGSADYFATADTGLMESREQVLSFETEFRNSDRFEFDIVSQYERLDTPFEILDGVEIPAGGYDFRFVELVHTFGQQRRASGQFLFRSGSFYNGHITVVELDSGRVEASRQLSFEPSFSINKIELPTATATTTLARGRVTYTVTPRMFLSGLLQFNTENNRVSTNLRLRWEYRPGSELFVVYSEDRDRDGRAMGFAQPRSRGLAIKINRLFRY